MKKYLYVHQNKNNNNNKWAEDENRSNLLK